MLSLLLTMVLAVAESGGLAEPVTFGDVIEINHYEPQVVHGKLYHKSQVILWRYSTYTAGVVCVGHQDVTGYVRNSFLDSVSRAWECQLYIRQSEAGYRVAWWSSDGRVEVRAPVMVETWTEHDREKSFRRPGQPPVLFQPWERQ